MRRRSTTRKRTRGSALLEFAVALPVLVLFIVGIYDFSGAFNQKQKLGHAAQEGATFAGAQPMTDMDPTASVPPQSLQPVVEVIFNSLAASNVLPAGNMSICLMTAAHTGDLKWKYSITSCTPDLLTIEIDRGVLIDPGPPASVRTTVTVNYPYHWRFNSVIQVAPTTDLSETASVHNQM